MLRVSWDLWRALTGSTLALLPAVAGAATVELAVTGQTTCYDTIGTVISCSGTGQDAETRAGIPWPDPRFSNNGDGTITDNLTGLIWLQEADCFGRSKWLDALAAINGLASGECGLTDGSGTGDWRLPNILELVSLSNTGVANPGDWLETYGFTGLYGVALWSSTTVVNFNRSNAFAFSPAQGFMASGAKGNTYEVWAVRGSSTGPAPVWKTGQTTCYDNLGAEILCAGTGQDGDHKAGVSWPDPRFTANADGTVTDNLSGLIWLQNASCFGDRAWPDALSDAMSLADGACGLADGSTAGSWRLPNTREIITLVDHSRTGPALPDGHPFLNVPASGDTSSFWSSNTWAQNPSWAWFDTFTDLGQLVFGNKTTLYGVWPLRGGQVASSLIFGDGFETGDTSAWSSSAP